MSLYDCLICNFPMTPHVRPSVGRLVRRLVGEMVGWLVGWSVCHNFLNGRKVIILCSYWSTCSSPETAAEILDTISTLCHSRQPTRTEFCFPCPEKSI